MESYFDFDNDEIEEVLNDEQDFYERIRSDFRFSEEGEGEDDFYHQDLSFHLDRESD